ncbi:hypothetical protein [Rossellomorea aquimaris]|uniref:hypothetical protein n=1 Tax=Rossellomorea aquimaris TaxID=189382 RepID=UPI0007D0765B|nr:hypothetical protein [Rossellomorea aquimaris]
MEKIAIWVIGIVSSIIWISVIALLLLPGDTPTYSQDIEIHEHSRENRQDEVDSDSKLDAHTKDKDFSTQGLTKNDVEHFLTEDKVSIDVLLEWITNKKTD